MPINKSNTRPNKIAEICIALERAGQLAIRTAIETNTGIISTKDGRMTIIKPNELIKNIDKKSINTQYY